MPNTRSGGKVSFIKGFILHFILFIIFDLIWFSVAGGFFAKQLAPIARMSEGNFTPRLAAAAGVYLLMAFALEFFVFSGNTSTSHLMTAYRAAILGLVIYGVFDLTNRALLAHYPIPMVIVDMAWGTILFFAVAMITANLRSIFNY